MMLTSWKPLRTRNALRRYCISRASPFTGLGAADSVEFLVLMSNASPASVWKIVEPVCSSYINACQINKQMDGKDSYSLLYELRV